MPHALHVPHDGFRTFDWCTMRVTGRGGMRWVKWVKWVERLAGPRDRLGEGLGDRLGERRETRRATGPSVPGQASAHGLSLARGAPVR